VGTLSSCRSSICRFFFTNDARISPEAVKRLIALEKEAGNIKEDVEVSQLADLSLVDEALRQSSGR
jgi:hypothetical protein